MNPSASCTLRKEMTRSRRLLIQCASEIAITGLVNLQNKCSCTKVGKHLLFFCLSWSFVLGFLSGIRAIFSL